MSAYDNIDDEDNSNFECIICCDTASSPVITQCGHLYCWPCLYHWLNTNRTHLVCPVCKSGISEDTIIPVYSKDGGQTGNTAQPAGDIPPRPRGRRRDPVENSNLIGNSTNGGTNFSFNSMFNVHNSISLAGYGYFPPLMFQALTNKCDPEINPMDGTRLIPQASRTNIKNFGYFLVALFIFVLLIL